MSDNRTLIRSRIGTDLRKLTVTMKPLLSLYKFHQGNMVTEKCCSQGKGQITRQLDSSFFIIKNKVVIGHGKLSKLYVEGGSGHFHITINRLSLHIRKAILNTWSQKST